MSMFIPHFSVRHLSGVTDLLEFCMQVEAAPAPTPGPRVPPVDADSHATSEYAPGSPHNSPPTGGSPVLQGTSPRLYWELWRALGKATGQGRSNRLRRGLAACPLTTTELRRKSSVTPPLGQCRQLDGKSKTSEQGSQRKGENQGSVPAGVCSVASCGTFSRPLPLVGLTDPIFQSDWSGRTIRQSLLLLHAPTSHYSTA